MGNLENVFKQPVLDLLYDSISIDFEKAILNDKEERKKYYDLSDEENKLQDMLIEIVGNENEKMKKMMGLVRELENYCCQETEYWNKKYFKLGFAYMLQIIAQKDKVTGNLFLMNENKEKDKFSLKVHDFLDILRQNKVSIKQKRKLKELVGKLKKGSETQKRRFSFYYNLINEDNILKVKDIAEIEKCNSSSIRPAIVRITALLVNSRGEIKEELEKIIDNKI